MAGRREAWCARCDELRPARPATPCPVCGRRLLAVPAGHDAELRGGAAWRLGRRLGGALPALRAASTGLVVLAVVAGTFAAGRATRTTPATQPASPAATLPGFAEAGPLAGRRLFGWRDERSGVAMTLEGVEVGGNFTRLDLSVAGLAAGEAVAEVSGLRIRDAAGRDLVPADDLADLNPTSAPRGPDGGVDWEVRLAAPIDWRQVAEVRLDALTVSHEIGVRLRGSLVDPKLRRVADRTPDELRTLPACADCTVALDACRACRTVQVLAAAYRRPAVVLVLAPRGPLRRSAVNPGGHATVTAEPDGRELRSWRDTDPDGRTAVGFDAQELAFQTRPGRARMAFSLTLTADSTRDLRGPWTMTQRGTPP